MKNKNILKKIISIILILLIIYIVSNINTSLAESVKTMKIVIDPGHGGHETGAINYNDGIVEKDITLKTAKYLKEFFDDYYGVEVIMTHNGLDNNTEMSVLDRGMCARNNKADLLLCLHFNAAPSGTSWHGAEVYVTDNTSCYKYNKESSEIGNLILSNLSKLGIYNRGVKTRLCNDTGPKWEYSDGTRADYYGIIRYAMKGNAEDRGEDITKGTGITSILIEHCFIAGNDVKFINTDAKLKQLALCDGKAVVEHYGLKLKKDVVAEIILNKTSVNMLVGEKTKIEANINPSTAINKKINWYTDNDKIAKVDSNGNITAVGEGTVNITAVADGNDKVFKKIKVTVTDVNIEIENGNAYSMIVGEKVKLFTDVPIENSKITWKSSDENIATVTNDGIVKGLKEGKVKITAKLDKYNKEDTIEVTVNSLKENESIKIEKYKEENGIISNFERNLSKEEFAKNIKLSGNLKIKIDTDSIVGSKTKIEILRDGKTIKTYICKLYGDINGDGKISSMDYMLIKNKIMEVKNITGDIEKSVADVNNDGKISALDYMLIKNDILDVKKINIR